MEGEKTFEDFIMEEINAIKTENSDTSAEETTPDNEPETETETDVAESETEVSENGTDGEETETNEEESETENTDGENDAAQTLENDETNVGGSEKDRNAFIKLRQESQGYKKIVDYFDAKAKEMGFSGVDELIKKQDEADLKKKAEAQGIPLEIAKKLQSLEAEMDEMKTKDAERIENEKKARLNSTIGSFIDSNKLSKDQVSKIADGLAKDSISIEMLSELPSTTVTRILKSYMPETIARQKQIEKVEKAKKELPVDANTSNNSSQVDDEIDKIAKYFVNMD